MGDYAELCKRLRAAFVFHDLDNMAVSSAGDEAADAIESLTTERDAAQAVAREAQALARSAVSMHAQAELELKDVRAERDALKAECERLRKDAERYRWLRTNRRVLLLTGLFGNGCVNRTIEEVDAYIAGCIAGEKE